ncbi:MAG TPA: hypothetical protein VEV39_15420 [Gemmatimonadales bacterium]|nr:hypothetical protein [Gemmatimonadales bacterium]
MIDGDHDGAPGGDAVAILPRGGATIAAIASRDTDGRSVGIMAIVEALFEQVAKMGTIAIVRRAKVLVFSGCNSHPATGSLQPVAIGAAVEVTKPSEPPRNMGRSGDAASRQAVTRVNVEQASKRPM